MVESFVKILTEEVLRKEPMISGATEQNNEKTLESDIVFRPNILTQPQRVRTKCT